MLQFLARFPNPLIVILLATSALSAAAGDVPSFVVIASIVLLSITLDFVQEMCAQNVVAALRRSVAVQATWGALPSVLGSFRSSNARARQFTLQEQEVLR